MFKGVKFFGRQNKVDNGGDSIYELTGKWKAQAKKTMHKTFRTRGKVETKNMIKEVD